MISAFNPETDKTNLEQTMIAANRVDNTQQEQKRRSELEERTKYHERAYRNECPGGSKGTPVGSKSFNMSKE